MNQTSVEVGILKHSPIHAEFQDATDPLHSAIWDKVKANRKQRYVPSQRAGS